MKIYKNLDLQDLEGEVWKNIKNFTDYKISNLSRIKSLKYRKEKILKQVKNNMGYFCIGLHKDGKQKVYLIHILLYETFNNYELKKDECIHHRDYIKENNTNNNFQLMTIKEHSKIHMEGENNPNIGSKRTEKSKIIMSINHFNTIGENNPAHKLEEWQVRAIYQILNSSIVKRLKITQKEIGEIFGVNQRTVSSIKTRKIWNHIIDIL